MALVIISVAAGSEPAPTDKVIFNKEWIVSFGLADLLPHAVLKQMQIYLRPDKKCLTIPIVFLKITGLKV